MIAIMRDARSAMFCLRCGIALSDHAAFCQGCGARLPTVSSRGTTKIKTVWLRKVLGALVVGVTASVLVLGGLRVLGSNGAGPIPTAMVRGDLARDGVYLGHGVRVSPVLAWRFPVDKSAGSPVVLGSSLYITGTDGELHAIDRVSGREIWKQSLAGQMSDPAAAGDRVYVGYGEPASQSDATPRDGHVSALEAGSGTEIWRTDTIGNPRAPVVDDQNVYVGTAGGYVYALNASSGKISWSFDGRGSYADVAVATGAVYVTLGNADEDGKGRIYSLNASDGRERWRTSLDAANTRAPAVRDGFVYAAAGSELYALVGETGKEVWRFGLPGFSFTSVAVGTAMAFVASGTEGGAGYLHAIERASGRELWRLDLGDAGYGSSPALADGVVYVGSLDHHLYAVDATNGAELWRFETGDSIYSSPAVVDGEVYFGSNFGYVYAVRAGSQVGAGGSNGSQSMPFSDLIEQARARKIQRIQVGQSGLGPVLYWLVGEDRGYQTEAPSGRKSYDAVQEALGQTGIAPENWPPVWQDGNR